MEIGKQRQPLRSFIEILTNATGKKIRFVDIFVKPLDDLGAVINTVPQYSLNDSGGTKPYSNGVLITNDPVQPYQCANKKYVDDAIAKVFSVTIYEAGE